MAAGPCIVSLWPGKEERDLICSGLLLTGRHILTVRHAFAAWPEEDPVYVRLIEGVSVAPARVLQRHHDYDAAILELTTPVAAIVSPEVQQAPPSAGMPPVGVRDLTLRFIDPDHFGWSAPDNYAIASFDHATGEYVIAPENARGSSGGVAEYQGRIIGLLSRRKKEEPLCRAVAMHLLWPWIESVVAGAPGATPGPMSPPPPLVLSPAYRALVAEVRKRVRERLEYPGTADLVHHWGADPLAALAAGSPAAAVPERVRSLLYGLHRATVACLPAWQRQRDGFTRIADDCRALLSDLVKLAVNPAADSDLAAIAAARPEQVHLTCQFGGTGDLVYCALADIPHLLTRRGSDRDIQSTNAIPLDDLLPSGTGGDQRQEILRKLWKLVMDGDAPGRIEGRDFDLLMARIRRKRDRDQCRYFITTVGPPDWCRASEHRRWADELHLGLVVHQDGDCCHLLLDEPDLIDTVREYLELLERP
jgi:hypothetical protein